MRVLPSLLSLALISFAAISPAHADPAAPGQGAPANAKVNFIEPKDGAVVPATFHVKFGLTGMAVRKAGEDPFDRASGHHHLLIDADPVPQGSVVPADEHHLHFGKGQTETDVTLSPGPHTLQLQLGDGAHFSYGPQLSAVIHVTVAAPKAGN
jgi:hypothetical protein